jgi:hypothetical protein
LNELKKVLDKWLEIISRYRHTRYTGSVSLIVNLSQGGIGTVKIESEKKVKDVNGNGFIRIISEELLK